MVTAKGSADATCQLIGREYAIRFNHSPFAMSPLGFNGVKPGAFDWQTTNQDPNSLAVALYLSIVFPDPGGYLFADMPRGIVPDQCQHTFVHRCQPLARPLKKLNGDVADRASVHETQ